MTTAISFQDCYKYFFLSYCDFTNWTGDDAKWIDDCQDSNTETITVVEFTKDATIGMWNNADQDQNSCWPGYVGPHAFKMSSYFVNNFFSYLRDQKIEQDLLD